MEALVWSGLACPSRRWRLMRQQLQCCVMEAEQLLVLWCGVPVCFSRVKPQLQHDAVPPPTGPRSVCSTPPPARFAFLPHLHLLQEPINSKPWPLRRQQMARYCPETGVPFITWGALDTAEVRRPSVEQA